MLTNQLATKYAQALYELAASKNLLEQVQGELSMVESTIASYPDLSTLVYHPQVLAQVKKETIRKVFTQELTDFVLNFLLLLIDKHRETVLSAIIGEYSRLANDARGRIEAEVTTAIGLSQDEESALINKLNLVTGKSVVLKTQINKAIIGGVVIKIGDKLIDGSVARQLENLKNALLNTEVTGIEVTDCI